MIDSTPAARPERISIDGRYIRLEPLSVAKHGEALWQATKDSPELYRYLPWGPFATQSDFAANLAQREASADPLFWAIIDRTTNTAVGYASLMRIDHTNRVIEVGGILFSPKLSQTRGATEAMYLMAKYAFDGLGNRRYEWKCNALNEPSRRAALRLGFQYEGVFRQHMIVKGENRDTAWYSMLDSEWPAGKAAFEAYLDPANFDNNGRQRSSLSRS